ncbi:hypothetical protein ACOME3_003050 [Neoechinorhynchus agilis]
MAKFPAVEPVSCSSVKKISPDMVAKRRTVLGLKPSDDLSVNQTPRRNPKSLCTLESINLDSSVNQDGVDCVTPGANVPVMFNDCEVTFDSYTIWCAYCEIYGNQLNDLLCPKGEKLSIREDSDGSPYIHGLAYVPCYTENEVLSCLKIGRRKLAVASTKLNERSSRSHSIFSFVLICDGDGSEPKTQQSGTYFTRAAYFCDLAGSERAKKADGNQDRFKEMCAINSSLSNLQRCIDLLRCTRICGGEPATNTVRPPYRSSKLTRLFQPFFEGRGAVRMMANVCFDPYLFDETVNVLKFCAMAQTVVFKRRAPCASKAFELAPKSVNLGNNKSFWVTEDDDKPFKVCVSELISTINELRQQMVVMAKEREDLLTEWVLSSQRTQNEHVAEMHNIENILTETYRDEMEAEMRTFRIKFQRKYGKYVTLAAERLKTLQKYGCTECKQRDRDIAEKMRATVCFDSDDLNGHRNRREDLKNDLISEDESVDGDDGDVEMDDDE